VDKCVEDKLINIRSSLKNATQWDEARTKTWVILPLIGLLGWDTQSPEVEPEYVIEKKKVDYCLHAKNGQKVFIEAKQTFAKLDDDEEQLLQYSFKEGVSLSVLTSGNEWRFYLPLMRGSWKDRCVKIINLDRDEATVSGELLSTLLAKSAIEDGSALTTANNLLTRRYEAQKLADTLPQVWNKIVSEPDPLLLELLMETVIERSGIKPDETTVCEFLKRQQCQHLISNVVLLKPVRQIRMKKLENEVTLPKPRGREAEIPDTQYEDGVKPPRYLMLEGKCFETGGKWKNILTQTADYLYANYRDNFISHVDEGKEDSRPLLSSDLRKMVERTGKPLPLHQVGDRSGVYLTWKYHRERIVVESKRMMGWCGLPSTAFRLTDSPD